MPEYHEVIGAGAIDKGDSHKTSDYDTTMNLYVANIYKMIKIHGGPSTRQFMNLNLESLNYLLEHIFPSTASQSIIHSRITTRTRPS